MTVFVLLGLIDYEASDVMGVFTSYEAAEKAFEKAMQYFSYDGMEIIEETLRS